MIQTSEFPTLSEVLSTEAKLTPMMEQYSSVKTQYPLNLVLFRMGDFYELFFEDAVKASKLLNIALTHRGKVGDFSIPMAGIPHHAASTYIDRLTSQGQKVVICEQIEDPKMAKGIVKRAVTQIASPGVPFDLEKAAQIDHYFIAAATQENKSYHLTLVDYTTGDFLGFPHLDRSTLISLIHLHAPKEFLCFIDQWEDSPEILDLVESSDFLTSYLAPEQFQPKHNGQAIESFIPHIHKDKTIQENLQILPSISAISSYLCSNQSSESLAHIKPFHLNLGGQKLQISYATMKGLEILPQDKSHYKYSLLGHMDSTKTAMGARKIREIFNNPSCDTELLSKRHDFLEQLIEDREIHQEIRKELFSVRDLERILAKMTSLKATPSDLLNLAQSLQIYCELSKIKALKTSLLPQVKKVLKIKELITNIFEKINDEPSASAEKGNLIKQGVNTQRDRLAKLAFGFDEALEQLENEYREQYQIPKLRIKSNNVTGYFIEISKSHTESIPEHFIRRQTLVNAERYQTQELTELEKEILSSKEKLSKLERSLFKEIIDQALELTLEIQNISTYLAELDVYQSFAWVAFNQDFCRPQFVKESKLVDIKSCFHPMIKLGLKQHFVPHDILLDSQYYFGLITGPNMAGKTTVMREVAIIQFLAQIGSFVPATAAKLSLKDHIFSRLGASDDIMRGQSTFMVEMSETAEILRHATENSLIILDEIGRGTSTYDGMSIAWALVEYLVEDLKATTLFSTHYHELIELVHELKHSKNLTVRTVKYRGQVRFLYELIEKGATQSFGINVAQLAGLPKKVLNRSTEILKRLEKQKDHYSQSELPLLQESSEIFIDEREELLRQEVQDLNLNEMSPQEALNKLFDLQKKMRDQ